LQLGDIAAAPDEGAREAVAVRLLDDAGHELLDHREAPEVAVDVLLRLVGRDAEPLREAETVHPVRQAEVDRFRATAQVAWNVFDGEAPHLGRRRAVD